MAKGMDISDKKIRELILSKYGGYCAYCGDSLGSICDMSIDHLVPKLRTTYPIYCERGGDNYENLMPCCKSCNSSKGTHNIETWRIILKSKIDRLYKESSLFRIAHKFGLLSIQQQDISFHFEKFNNV